MNIARKLQELLDKNHLRRSKLAQERLGHSTDHMLKTVYQHIMATTRSEVDDIVDQKFSTILHTDCTRENGDG